MSRLEPFPFRSNRNGALDSCFDAFSSREPVSTSLENALAERSNGVLASMTSTVIGFRVSAWLAGQTDLRNDIRNARCCSANGSASRPPQRYAEQKIRRTSPQRLPVVETFIEHGKECSRGEQRCERGLGDWADTRFWAVEQRQGAERDYRHGQAREREIAPTRGEQKAERSFRREQHGYSQHDPQNHRWD